MKPQIRERGGRFTVSVEVWSDGKRVTVAGGTHSTEKAAELAGWEIVSQYTKNPESRKLLQSQLVLRDWAGQWLKLVDDEVKASTLSTYRWRMEHWILPHLGGERLVTLTPGDISHWLDGLELAYKSKKAALTTLASCLEAAKDRGFIPTNVAHGVKLKQSRARQKSVKVKVWTPEEAQRLFDANRGMAIETVIALGLYGGLRRGEILGLRWSDVDWNANRITVSRNVVMTPHGILWNETPKTGGSRTVSLPPVAMEALRASQSRQEAETVLTGEVPQDVVSISPTQIRRFLVLACQTAGVPELSMHSLRHTHASLLLSAGASIKAVASRLGHNNPNITLATYAHCMPSDDQNCSAIIEASLNPGQTPDRQTENTV